MSSSWHIKGQRHFPNNKNHVIATCHRCCFCSRLCSRLQNCSPGKTIVAKFRNKMRKSQNCVFVRCCIHGQTQKSHLMRRVSYSNHTEGIQLSIYHGTIPLQSSLQLCLLLSTWCHRLGQMLLLPQCFLHQG